MLTFCGINFCKLQFSTFQLFFKWELVTKLKFSGYHIADNRTLFQSNSIEKRKELELLLRQKRDTLDEMNRSQQSKVQKRISKRKIFRITFQLRNNKSFNSKQISIPYIPHPLSYFPFNCFILQYNKHVVYRHGARLLYLIPPLSSLRRDKSEH